jgi:transposase
MEATGSYWEAVAEYLAQHQQQVSVVNPARIHAYAASKLARNKTDKLDADLIADFCASQQPARWVPLPPEVKELRALVRYLDDLQEMHTQESNRLQAGGLSPEVQRLLSEHLAFLDQQIEEVKSHIQEHIDQHPELKGKQELLISIQGIGKLTAARLLGENIQEFTSTRELTAFTGLNPCLRESGSSVHGKPRLSKMGNPYIRKALYLPAISAMRWNAVVKTFCERMAKRGKPKMVQIGAAMRKLLCLALGVLKSGIPFDPDYLVKVQAGS